MDWKREREFTFFKYSFFENILLLNLKKFSSLSSDRMLSRNFTRSNSVTLVADLYLQFHGSYNICIYMGYLSVCNRSLFKSYDCYILFDIRKALQILWRTLLTPSPYILEKRPLLNKHKKQISCKKNKSLYLWRREKWPNFSLKHLSFSMRSQTLF